MRNRIFLGVFLLLAVAGAVGQALLSPPRATDARDRRASTENPGPRGARALYLWLRELGYESRSWRRPLGAIDDEVRALFVLEPTQDVTAAQADALVEWVAGGGTLFLAPGGSTELEERVEQWVALDFDRTEAADVRGDRVVPDDGESWRYREVSPDDRAMFVYPVNEVAVRGDGRVRDARDEHSVLFARRGLGFLAEVYHGDGVVVVFPEADLLTNRGLAKADNPELVASLVADWIEPGTGIWFDEYHHGARVAGSVLAYLGQRRPGLFAVAFLAAGVLAVRRWGRALRVRPEAAAARRRRPTEFVDALGMLYARSRAVGPAWSALARTAERCAGGGRRAEGAGLGGLRLAPDDREERIAALRRTLSAGRRGPTEDDLVSLATALARAVETPGGEERR